ncbi:Hydroxyproline dehydrogenase [Dissostichus eleginoides]|uniref:Hydroxyproline dehydrogenase n=1 Tax=Dissostichus eleginoides TaxID=100907 RepID=A0AAD9BNM3_DISEL|nr:Hydroxyproline dehydrogenase [Dissostichus eleginoides]
MTTRCPRCIGPYLVRRAQENQTVLQGIRKERDLPAGGSADTGIDRPPSPANSSGHPPSHPNPRQPPPGPSQNTLRGPGHPLPSPLLPNPPLLPTPSTQQLPLSQRTPRLRFSTRNPTSSKPTSPITTDTTIPATSDQNPILPGTTLSRTSSLHQHSPPPQVNTVDLSSPSPPIPTAKIVIISIGINNKDDDPHRTTGKQLRSMIKHASETFPRASIYIPLINHSPCLTQKQKHNIQLINDSLTKHHNTLQPLPQEAFRTTHDNIYWTPPTAQLILDSWGRQLHF